MVWERLRVFAASVIVRLYAIVFRREPGTVAMGFIKNLGYIFTGFTVAKIISVAFQIYTGRMLGPVEYGKFAMVYSLSQIFVVPMLMGVGSSIVNYFAGSKNEEERKVIFTGSVFLISAFTAVTAAIVALFANEIAALTAVSPDYVLAAVLLAVFYNAWVLPQKVYQITGRMKRLGTLNVGMNGLMLVMVLVAFMYGSDSMIPVAVMCAAYLAAVVVTIPELRKYMCAKLDTTWMKRLAGYGAIIVVGMMSLALTDNINKILLNVFMSFQEVGLYQAYFFSTLNMSTFFATAVTTVLFPKVSSMKDKHAIFSQMNSVLKITPVLFPVILGLSWVIMVLYGSSYAASLPMLVLFVIAAMLNFAHIIYGCIALSAGMRGVKVNTASMIVISVISVGLAYMFIPTYGIYGAIVTRIVAFIAGFVFLRIALGRIISR